MAATRGVAFEQAVWAAAEIEGEIFSLTPDTWRALQKEYPAQKTFGLGDAIAAVATPIAKVFKMGCIDPATKQLRPDSGCAKRKAALNKIIPKL